MNRARLTAKEVAEVKITTYPTPAAPTFAAARVRMTPWVSPVQGIDMSGSASVLGGNHAMTSAPCVATATAAAKGATRKNAQGGEAFEDPV